MALPRVVSEIFNVETCRDFEIQVRGHLRSSKVVPFDRLCMVSYYRSIVTLSIRCTVFIYLTCSYTVTLKPGLGVTQGHRNQHGSIRHL